MSGICSVTNRVGLSAISLTMMLSDCSTMNLKMNKLGPDLIKKFGFLILCQNSTNRIRSQPTFLGQLDSTIFGEPQISYANFLVQDRLTLTIFFQVQAFLTSTTCEVLTLLPHHGPREALITQLKIRHHPEELQLLKSLAQISHQLNKLGDQKPNCFMAFRGGQSIINLDSQHHNDVMA